MLISDEKLVKLKQEFKEELIVEEKFKIKEKLKTVKYELLSDFFHRMN